MIYTTKELLELGETEYSIRNRLKTKTLYLLERGIYSDNPLDTADSEVFISKKYPSAIITGLSALYIYDLTDHIPDYHYLATEQHSFPIRRKDVKQSYQHHSFFSIGVTTKHIDGGNIRIYDLERLLIELFRLKEKYPREIFYEALDSFRKIREKLDFYKVNQYLKSFTNGENLLLKIKESI